MGSGINAETWALQLSKKKWENIRGNQITLPSPARPGAQTSVFTSRTQGSRQHHQAYAIEKSYCLPQERYSKERMRSFPSLQRRCRPMCPGKLLKFCLSSVTHMNHMDFIG